MGIGIFDSQKANSWNHIKILQIRGLLTSTKNLTVLAITTSELSTFSILAIVGLTKNQKKVLM